MSNPRADEIAKPVGLPSFNRKYWPTVVGLYLFWFVVKLPWRWQIAMGKGFGTLLYKLVKRRTHITRTNLKLCFPQLSTQELEELTKKTMQSNAIGLVEMAFSWWAPYHRIEPLIEFKGLEHLHAIQARGKGILLLGGHFTHLDFSGRVFTMHYPAGITYRAHTNPVINEMLTLSRTRNFETMAERKEMRHAMRALKRGEVIWYAGDQDYGREHSVFAPFFGHLASTITAGERLAKGGHAEALFFRSARKEDGSGYLIEVIPLTQTYPAETSEASAAIQNHLIEEAIKAYPDQYMWVHRRFKTRPNKDDASFY